jgi:hypothetical protein
MSLNLRWFSPQRCPFCARTGATVCTLKYRLQQIRDITGCDLNDPDTRFSLQLSTRAWRTLRALRDEEARSTAAPTPARRAVRSGRGVRVQATGP